MKPTPHTPIDRVRKSLAFGLAALLTASFASGQTADADALRRLQEENAALRRQLAELQGRPQPAAPAAAPAAPSAQPSPVAPTTSLPPPAEDGVITLSPFTVSTANDYGYLKTNSATATRIGTEIQKVPLSISVIGEELIRDANMSDIQDVLRYQASSAGDTRMGVLQPATGFTVSGSFTLRGFPINSRLRNGLLRYTAYNLDNVERVEVINGPAAVFFGQAFPGGVINYVTKQPQFQKIPTTLNFGYGGTTTRMGSQKVTLDHNAVFSNKAAFRFVGSWENMLGDRRFEFQDGYSVTPSISFLPLDSGKLKITVESELIRRKRNQDDTSWSYPEQWLRDYAAPPAALIAAANLQNAADPVAAYRTRIFGGPGNWIVDRRVAEGNPYLALWTAPLEHGAYITNAQGQRVYDPKFNYYGAGTYSDEEVVTTSAVVEASPLEWLDARYAFTVDNSRYTETKSTASPNADGITWNTLNGILARDYFLNARTHQADIVLKKDFLGMGHKLLFGGVRRESKSRFTGTNAANLNGTGQFPFFGNLPGSFDKPDEGYVSPIPAQFRTTTFAPNFSQQFIRRRDGTIMNPVQIFSQYDPGIHVAPDIGRITEIDRGLVDAGRPTRKEWYLNYQLTALDNRLTGMLGYREEKQSTVGQLVEANPPWYTVPDFALQNIPQSQWAEYGLSAIFSRPRVTKGDSKMAGVSYEVARGINLYASYSETYLPSGVTFLGGDYDPVAVRNRAISLGLNPDTEIARIEAGGGLRETQNETGENIEFGVKANLKDNKIVGTLSFFRLERANRTVDDVARQNDDPINWTGPNRTGTSSRLVRWYSNDAVERTEGTELEVIWTPIRNYQARFNASWIWDAQVLSDPSVNPNTPIGEVYFRERLTYVPEYRLNVFQKYTFTDGVWGDIGRGASIGLGTRYSSKMNVTTAAGGGGLRDMNFNPATGGYTAGNYVVFDAVFGYPIEVLGYQLTASLNITNLFDKEYSEGGFNLSPPRTWLFTTGLKF